ncbi:MAG: hypothetical protein F4117_01625 [Acidimicrobiales bacterium]|nr:hypothetical protein [Acidimicrobiales bacterium]MXX41833.1 hypothetical protein [Acidimicrobiales bacterium]MXZ14243.1 hypothetical protein [Acidimicrobiales bacterium]MYB83091.1 hypothetical protein [Acidimicrobiales bacterium]MYD33807.1 hypothetical protein [Acidimicrobiales bacterium]
MSEFGWIDALQVTAAFSGPLAALFAGFWAMMRFSHKTLGDKIDASVAALRDSLDTRTDAIERRFDAVDRRLDSVDSSIAYLGQQVAGVKERVAHIEGRLGLPSPEPEQA